MKDHNFTKEVVSGDERVTVKWVIELTMRGKGGGEDEAERGMEWCMRKRGESTQAQLEYKNRILERLDGGLKKGGRSRHTLQRGGRLAKRGRGCNVRSRRRRRRDGGWLEA
jgi:hypothetical protein